MLTISVVTTASLVLFFLNYPTLPGLMPSSMIFTEELLLDHGCWVLFVGAVVNGGHLLAGWSVTILIATIIGLNSFAILYQLEELQ